MTAEAAGTLPSRASGAPSPTPPRLTFQLPGRWLAVDPRDQDAAYARVDAVVREIVGPGDDAAIARRRLRDQLRRAVDAARDAAAHAMFLCLEIVPELATPMSLTVHAPSAMRMSPAVGTSADAVLGVLRESFGVLAVAGIETARRLDGPRTSMLRIDRVHEEIVEEDGVQAVATRLEAEYWYAVPGSKQVVLASFATPLGELRHAMLNLFDSIALAAFFGEE
ncbi:hypothetical protein [Microbacterium sp. CFBP9034]|uniref:hypothetical protein n=1 Tax=Microbacterium sp. CFBP9034 TaxID=3096540 RepID=UPI002A699217|nr:hypothetical protein [Microbacterium sp. CFBP9034]MDY0907950.1 hypothetical protein [Microbacterium sp. CFBP9034]